jgi:hypothetical protein
MFTFSKPNLSEQQIHQILSNPRRCSAIQHLCSSSGTISVRDLSEVIATAETGQSPAPRNVRESVYISLHQTHLPKLHELGVIEYDLELKEVYLLDAAKDLDRYMDVVNGFGVTWGGFYRSLGVVGLASVVAALADVPGFAALDPLLWATGFLTVFSLSTAYQLWADRWALVRNLRR